MTHHQMIQTGKDNSTKKEVLYIALELSQKKWKLVLSDGRRKREKTIPAGDREQFEAELLKARKHFKMADEVEMYSCYEAGRDGFWIHRSVSGKCGDTEWLIRQALR